jgi:hypothetical protein
MLKYSDGFDLVSYLLIFTSLNDVANNSDDISLND